jgi:hypothetical protein
VQRCPWCGGVLQFYAKYPVRQLIPGDTPAPGDAAVPEAMRTRPAWRCATPHCRYREQA